MREWRNLRPSKPKQLSNLSTIPSNPQTNRTINQAGQEKFHALGPIYYREANGALLVYDVTSPDSLRKVRDWVRELNKMLGKQNVCLAIIGNKSDLLNGPAGGGGGSSRPATSANNYQLQQQQQESQLVQEAVALADELQNARHYLTSAKLNQGIGELFVSLAKRMLDQHKRLAAQRRDSRLMLASSRLARSNQNLSGNNNDDDDYYNENTKDQPRVIDRARRGPATSGASKANAGSCQC